MKYCTCKIRMFFNCDTEKDKASAYNRAVGWGGQNNGVCQLFFSVISTPCTIYCRLTITMAVYLHCVLKWELIVIKTNRQFIS